MGVPLFKLDMRLFVCIGGSLHTGNHIFTLSQWFLNFAWLRLLTSSVASSKNWPAELISAKFGISTCHVTTAFHCFQIPHRQWKLTMCPVSKINGVAVIQAWNEVFDLCWWITTYWKLFLHFRSDAWTLESIKKNEHFVVNPKENQIVSKVASAEWFRLGIKFQKSAVWIGKRKGKLVTRKFTTVLTVNYKIFRRVSLRSGKLLAPSAHEIVTTQAWNAVYFLFEWITTYWKSPCDKFSSDPWT